MTMKYRWITFLFSIILVSSACALPVSSAATTPTAISNSSSGSGSSSQNNSNPSQSTPSSTPSLVPTVTPTSTVTPTATLTLTPTPSPLGSYSVKQIQTLGHETISGAVCNLTKPFQVNVAAPAITFLFNFYPTGPVSGKWAYAYQLPKAGETHDANGNYTVSKPEHDGTLHIKMSGSDHVVFKGFDGKIPSRYAFDLVPDPKAVCPTQ